MKENTVPSNASPQEMCACLWRFCFFSCLCAVLCCDFLPSVPAPALALAENGAEGAAPLPCANTREARSRLVRGHWSEDKSVMRAMHKPYLLERMEEATLDARPTDAVALENCVLCHVKRNTKGRPVAASDASHFCRSCHAEQGIRIGCFSCHASLPAEDPTILEAEVRNSETLGQKLVQWKQGGVRP